MRNKPLFLQLLLFVLPIYIIGFGVQYYFVGPFIERFRLDEVQRHLSKKANLHSIVDISDSAKKLSAKYKIQLHSNVSSLLNSKELDQNLLKQKNIYQWDLKFRCQKIMANI